MIAYMEAIVRPLRWDDFGHDEGIFRTLRSPEGERMIIDGNFSVEAILPRSVIRKLREEEMAAYRGPFLAREDRWPTLCWPRQIPVDGEPPDVNAIVEHYATAMSRNAIPKLLIAGEPGAIIKGSTLEFCRTWPNQTELKVPGIHFLQEDSPDEIGQALRDFVKSASLSSLSTTPSLSSLEPNNAA
jgi:haloalkane dehalogenase